MIKNMTTESGSRYEFEDRDGAMFVRRSSGPALRGDGAWLRLRSILGEVRVGLSVRLLLEPLGEGSATYRFTTAITMLEEAEEAA